MSSYYSKFVLACAGYRGGGVAKPAQEAAAALAGSTLDPGCCHTKNTFTHSVFQLLFPLGSIYVGISMPVLLVRAVVAICSCVGAVPVTEDATRMLGSGTSSLGWSCWHQTREPRHFCLCDPRPWSISVMFQSFEPA